MRKWLLCLCLALPLGCAPSDSAPPADSGSPDAGESSSTSPDEGDSSSTSSDATTTQVVIAVPGMT
jgi:hypothetical protein